MTYVFEEFLRDKEKGEDSGVEQLAKEVLATDEHILQVTIILENGEIEARTSRPGYENRFDFDKNTNEQWGTWVVITLGLIGQFDKVLTETEYVTIGRKNYKGMLIPISYPSARVLIGLILERSIETNLINEKVRSLLRKQEGKINHKVQT